jgi:sigma-E factor negative regulatory protein RseB
MFKFRHASLLIALLALVVPAVYADNADQQSGTDLLTMLKRMSQADAYNNYSGTFVLFKTGELSSIKVTHGKNEQGVWETLESLNGEPRKVLRHNDKVISVYPDRGTATIRKTGTTESLHYRLPDNIEQLARYYSMSKLEDSRIAGRPALVIDLIPNDPYRYGYRYWIDNETGMLLRCDLKDENSIVVEHMMFTSLEYLDQVPTPSVDLSRLQDYKQQFVDETGDEMQLSEVSWKVNNLPEGFVLTQSIKRKHKLAADSGTGASNRHDLIHLVYSDGLASVSVFIETSQADQKHLSGPASMGAVNAFGQAVDDYYVTVVGEVPENTVRRIAQSLVRIAPLAADQ